MSVSGLDRRLGARYTVAWVEVRWRFASPNPDPAQPPTVESVAGFLIDVSVSGAGLVAPYTPHLAPGSVAGLEYGELRGTVTVRRINQFGPDPSCRLYGIEFTEAHSPLTVGLRDAFLAQRSQLPAWRDPRSAEDAPPPVVAPVGDPVLPPPLDASGFGFGPP